MRSPILKEDFFQSEENEPFPSCCFSPRSILEIFKEPYVLQILNRLLKGGIEEHWLDRKSDLQIKILDLISKLYILTESDFSQVVLKMNI